MLLSFNEAFIQSKPGYLVPHQTVEVKVKVKQEMTEGNERIGQW